MATVGVRSPLISAVERAKKPPSAGPYMRFERVVASLVFLPIYALRKADNTRSSVIFAPIMMSNYRSMLTSSSNPSMRSAIYKYLAASS